MARQLVLMGSGETAPTMVETHKRVLRSLGPSPEAILLDTPYGFQENADDLTARAVDYFAQRTGAVVRPVSLRDAATMPAGAIAEVAARVEEADWLFAGPGSPTYLRRQWAGTDVPAAIRRRLARPGATVFASAAVCSVGARTVPVYEIYKVGEPPHWEEGFDFTADLGLSCVVVPHFDNTEGGGHDTRYCYLGERRLRRMEADLPDDTWVLGIDEHTALIVDLDEGRVAIEGRGVVTVRMRDQQVTFSPGDMPSLDDLQSVGHRDAVVVPHPLSTTPATGTTEAEAEATPLLDEVARLERAFGEALSSGDALRAAEAVVRLEETIDAWRSDATQSDEVDRARRTLHRLVLRLARATQAGLHDHRDLIAPLVEELLDLRADARAEQAWDVGDRIRDRLQEAGVEVRDTAEGADWGYEDPLVGAE